MGYIDADCHGIETRRETWKHFDPSERHYGPPEKGLWTVENAVFDVDHEARETDPAVFARLKQHYPDGSRDLSNIPARLAVMDQLGVDVQVCYSNFWLLDSIQDPMREAAIARSWNRWAALGTEPAKGRIRWLAHIPWRIPERAFQEMEFAAKNGAAGFEFTGYKYEIAAGNPWWYPLYAKAQELNMCIAFHTGGNGILFRQGPLDFFYRTSSRVPGSFHSLLANDVPKKFPNLRFAFIETSAMWVPFALAVRFRTNGGNAGDREFGDWRQKAKDYLQGTNLYVDAYIDEDIPYTVQYTGEERMVVGTDYTHIDFGSDPEGLNTLMKRTDIAPHIRRKIVDDNPRRLYGIPAEFRPADQAVKATVAAH